MSRTILIVEPHASVAVLLERILTTSDWTTHVCDDAGAAVAYVGRHRVDAVLCDYSTELITGTNLRELRDFFEPTPLVLTSTWDKAAEVAAAMKVLFLKKPFNLEDVESIIRHAMMLGGPRYTVDQPVVPGRQAMVAVEGRVLHDGTRPSPQTKRASGSTDEKIDQRMLVESRHAD